MNELGELSASVTVAACHSASVPVALAKLAVEPREKLAGSTRAGALLPVADAAAGNAADLSAVSGVSVELENE